MPSANPVSSLEVVMGSILNQENHRCGDAWLKSVGLPSVRPCSAKTRYHPTAVLVRQAPLPEGRVAQAFGLLTHSPEPAPSPPFQKRKNRDSNHNRFPEPEGAPHGDWSHRPEQSSQQGSEDKSADRREAQGSDIHRTIFHMEGVKLLGKIPIVA